MFNYNHYVPILKAKDGEFGALSELPEEIKSRISPVIDIFNSKSKKSLEDQLIRIANKIKTSWGCDRPIFVDLFGIDLKKQVSGGEHPLNFTFDRLRQLNVKAIPTTGFDRDEAYNETLKNIIRQDNRGTCIRLLTDDMESVDELKDNLKSLLSYLNISYQDVHLILDFRELKLDEVDTAVETAINVIREIPNINDWSTLTVASSGFPGSLKEISTHATGKIPRLDYQMWSALINRREEIERLPSFGNYGVQHPDLLELDWRIIPRVPNIRYTLPFEWLIIRGGTTKKNGSRQTFQLSRDLIRMSEYHGGTCCWGDSYISLCAQNADGPGNMTTWRKVGTNHHITLVSGQVAKTGVL
tara:strand:- start:2007 stop:3077 length:1071 start_codon:yes stop_codon:yes gene_type:complete